MVPYERNRGIKRPDVKGFNHYHAYIDACLGKGSTGSNFDFAGPLAEATCLGLIGTRIPNTSLERLHPKKCDHFFYDPTFVRPLSARNNVSSSA